MKFPVSYLITLAILGVILLYSYYYYFKNDNKSQLLWGKVKGNLLIVYYISMLLSAIGFLLLFSYLIVSNSFKSEEIIKIFVSLLCIIIISMFWMPLSLNYLHKKDIITKYFTIIVLFLVALSTLYLLYVLYNVKENNNILFKNLAFYGMLYFFIHAFFFDFITWSKNFF
jgi:hypothetical protein